MRRYFIAIATCVILFTACGDSDSERTGNKGEVNEVYEESGTEPIDAVDSEDGSIHDRSGATNSTGTVHDRPGATNDNEGTVDDRNGAH